MSWLKLDVSQSVISDLLNMREKLRSWDALTFFHKVREYFANELDPEDTAKIKAVIDLLNLGAKVDKIQAVVEKIPPIAWQLFTPLSQLNQTLALPLLSEGKSFRSVNGPWGASLGFDLTSDLSMDAYSARQLVPMVPGLSAEAGTAFFQIGGIGKLETKISGSFNFTQGSVEAGLRAGGQLSLAYLFKDVPASLVGTALLRHGMAIRSPFDLGNLQGSFQKSLRAVHFEAEGQLQLSGGLAVGQTWGRNFQVDSDKLGVNTPIGLEASASAGVQAGVRLSGGFDLLIQPAGNGWVSVRLERSQDHGKNLGINLKAQVDVSGLDVIGHAIMKKYVPDAQPLIDKLTPYLNLGDVLRGQLRNHLGGFLAEPENARLRDQLINTLTGVGDSDDLSEALLNIISREASQQLDVWESDANTVATDILTRSGQKLGLEPASQQVLLSGLQEKVTTSLGDIKADLVKDLNTWLNGKPKAELKSLLKPLNQFGAEVNEWVDQAQNLVDKVLKPLLSWLDRYQTLRNKAQKAVDGAARLKFGMQFSRPLITSKASASLLELELDPADDQANAFYKQILWGSFANVINAVREAGENGQALKGVKLKGGYFKTTLGRRIQTDFSVDFAGKVGGTQTVRDLNLAVTWDLSGNVQAASGAVNFSRTFKFLGEQRSASFMNVLELAGADQGNASKIFSSSVSLTSKDKRAKPKEIGDFLGSLEKVDLLAPGTTAAALRQYKEKDHTHGGAALALNLPLEGTDLKQFLAQSQKTILTTAFEQNKQIFLPEASDRRFFDEWFEAKFSGTDLLAKIDVILEESTPHDARTKFGGNSIKNKAHAYSAWTFSRNAKAMAEMQLIMKKVAAISLNQGDRQANLKKVYKLLKLFNDQVAVVLKVRKWLGTLFGKDSVPRSTLAFMTALRQLSQNSGAAAPLIPVIRWVENDEDIDSIILSTPEA